MPQSSSIFGRSFWYRQKTLPAIVFLFGFVLSVAAALMQQKHINADAEDEFQRYTLQLTGEIAAQFQKPIYGLNGFKSIYAARPKVRRDEFRAAVESRNLAQEFPGVRGFGFIEQVSRANLGVRGLDIGAEVLRRAAPCCGRASH